MTEELALEGQTEENQLEFWPQLIGIGAAAIGIPSFIKFGILDPERKRKQVYEQRSNEMWQIISKIKSPPHPKFLAVYNRFTNYDAAVLVSVAKTAGVGVVWDFKLTKDNVIMFSDKSGRWIVVANRPIHIASALTDKFGVTDWESVDKILDDALAENAAYKGFFNQKVYNNWKKDIERIKELGGVKPMSFVKRPSGWTILDTILLWSGIITVGILGYQLVKKQWRKEKKLASTPTS